MVNNNKFSFIKLFLFFDLKNLHLYIILNNIKFVKINIFKIINK